MNIQHKDKFLDIPFDHGTCSIHVREWGAGPVTLLIHGWLHSSEIWSDVATILSSANHVIAIDLPGFGMSPPLAQAFVSLESYATLLFNVISRLSIDQEIKCIAADSLAAILILKIAERRLLPTRKLILSGCPANGLTPFLRWLANFGVVTMTLKTVRNLPVSLATIAIRLLSFGTVYRLHNVSLNLIHAVLQAHPQTAARLLSALSSFRYQNGELIKRQQFHLIVLRGQEDRVVSSHTCFSLATTIGASYIEINGVGHTPMMEDPPGILRRNTSDTGGTRECTLNALTEILQTYRSPIVHTKSGFASTARIVGIIGFTLAIGTSYIPLQWYRRGEIKDAIFVSLLIAATMVLLLGLRQLQNYIATRGLDFYVFVLATSDPRKAVLEHQALCTSVMNTRRMTLSGLLYGAAIGSAPFILHVWKDDILLRATLAAFMFSVNFATGIAFYALISFFYHAVKMGSMVKVDLWQVENPSTNFLLGATRRLSVVASVYGCMCICSVLFSVLPLSGLVIGYSCFSAAVILASLAIPTFPVAQRLSEAKCQTLRRIDEQVQAAFVAALEKVNHDKNKIDLEPFECLLQLREKVEGVHTWPFKLKIISASFSVIFFASIPVILQTLLEKVLK